MRWVRDLARIQEELAALHVEVVLHLKHPAFVMEVLDRSSRVTPGDGTETSILDFLDAIVRMFKR